MAEEKKPEGPVPDFAMMRAVDILEKLARERMARRQRPPTPIDRSVVLYNEHAKFEVGVTGRPEIERGFGIGFPFPARGWHTWVLKEDGQRRLLSVFYKDDVLIAVEYYVPKSRDGGPKIVPREMGPFRMVPGNVSIGMRSEALSDAFVTAQHDPVAVVYEECYEVRFPGGVGFAMANKGRIERLVLYADLSTT